MAMDEEVLQLDRWSLQLQIGEEITLIPWDDEPFVVTDVFLVDPESATGQGVVAACVEMGTQNIRLAQLSSEVTGVELQTPVVLDEEFCISVTRPGGDSDADADTDQVAVVVQFEGFVLPLSFLDSDDESDEEEEEDEDTANSEEDDDKIAEDHEGDEESD
jgi:hypothetical protein